LSGPAVVYFLIILAGWRWRPPTFPSTTQAVWPPNEAMVFDRATPHARLYHEAALGSMGSKIAEKVALKIESDLAKLTEFFGGTKLPKSLNVYIKALDTGGAYHYGCSDERLFVDMRIEPELDIDYTSFLVASQAVDVFGAAQHNGWDCGNSYGAALKLVLAAELYPAEGKPFATAGMWLDSNRQDYISRPDSTDNNPVSKGCAVLFLNYLHTQLRIPWDRIIAAGGTSLDQTYPKLGLGNDGFEKFLQLMNRNFPVGQPSRLTTDNPFPLPSARRMHMCKLTAIAGGIADLTAATGKTITIGVTGTAAVILSAVYDGSVLAAPWQFTVGAGDKHLEVIVGNLTGDRMQLRELCDDGTSNIIRDFKFDPGAPSLTFTIRGV
jgi:hypothetical protein